MNARFARITALFTVAAATLVLGACESSVYEDVKADPSPDMDTLYQRPVDMDNAITVTFDENGRMFWQDLGRALYWDRPSRLTREPIPRP